MSLLLIRVVNRLGCESANADNILTYKKIFVLAHRSNLRCGKVILVFGPCADVRQANGATDLGPQRAAAR